MYSELYAAWQREIQASSLGGLSPDFYARIGDYLRHIREDPPVIDKKSVKLSLLDHETQNVQRMLEELLSLRYRKLIKAITQKQKLPSELLTAEETKMCESFMAFSEEYQKFAKTLLNGQTVKVEQPVKVESVAHVELAQVTAKRTTLRFIKTIPAIVGADMKSYGPFKVEDVASLPAGNAKMLVKQGLAAVVEVS